MVDAGVDIAFRGRHRGQGGEDGLPRRFRTELVGFGEVQDQPAAQSFQFLQGLLDTDAVVADGAGHLGQSTGRQVGQLAAQAVTHHTKAGVAHLGTTAQMVEGGADVYHAQSLVEGLVVAEGLLEILGGVAQFDARRLAPVEVRHQHAVALLGQLVGHGAHGGVDAEDLLAQDDARTAPVDGGHEVGVEGAGRRRYVDIGSGHRKRLQVAQVWNHLRRGSRCGAVRRLPRPSPWRS